MHRPGATNRVADAFPRNRSAKQSLTNKSFKKTLLAAFVGEAERCHRFADRHGDFEKEAGKETQRRPPIWRKHNARGKWCKRTAAR